jgi:hypothetical protein
MAHSQPAARRDGEIGDEAFHRLEEEMDLEELL